MADLRLCRFLFGAIAASMTVSTGVDAQAYAFERWKTPAASQEAGNGQGYESGGGDAIRAYKYGPETLAPRALQPQRLEIGGSEPARPAHVKIGRPYRINGVLYTPGRQDGYRDRGLASVYAADLAGNRTANGEVYNPNHLTGAHPTLPLPSRVRVTNTRTGRSTIIRINDRGPFGGRAIIALSPAAARRIDAAQGGEVSVQLLGEGQPSAERATFNEQYFVQVGAFSNRWRAESYGNALNLGAPAVVRQARVNGRQLHRVLVGPWPDQASADGARRRAIARGADGSRVVRNH